MILDYNKVKRVMDFCIALVVFLLLSPLFALAAILIKLTSKGSILYKGKRVGKNGKIFTMYKFRTMFTDADKKGPKLTYKNDPRVTPLGKYFRILKIDELPQFFNVLKGDMSLVGPRPEDPKYIGYYTKKQRKILELKPGMTGLAQLKYKNIEELLEEGKITKTYISKIIPEKYRLNMKYLQKSSLLFDIKILIFTLLSLFKIKRT